MKRALPLGILILFIVGFVVLLKKHNNKASDQVHLEIVRESNEIIQTKPFSASGKIETSNTTKELFKVLSDSEQNGDHRVAAASLLIQSWTEKDKKNAIQFILSSPFTSRETRINEFEITLRALILEALAESTWGRESLPELQKIAAFSESTFLSQRAELYRKWISGLGPNPKDLDEKVLSQILAHK